MVGHTAWDHLFRVSSLPSRHASSPIRDHKIYFGGGGANVAATISRLGGKCTLISAVGPEFAGSDYAAWMTEVGIYPQLFVVEGTQTPTAYIFTDDSGDQITFFEWGASSYFHRASAPALAAVHLATADPDFNARVAGKAAFCSFDPGQDLPWYSVEQLETILLSTTVLFANRHEMATLCEKLTTSIQALVNRIPIVVITMDVEGSILFTKGEKYTIPIVPVPLKDPTGAGDAYRAGFLTAYQKGYLPLTCCKVGTVTASFVVEKFGCQTNLPDWYSMVTRFQRHFGPLGKEGAV